MTTWTDLFEQAVSDARQLRDQDSYRAAISRIYYALYYCITARLGTGVTFRHGWSNPGHDQVRGLISQIPGLASVYKPILDTEFRALQSLRVHADYHPSYTIDRDEAKEAFRSAYTSFRLLGEKI